MVTDFDRNTRTLILSFSIAIMALIPLRFVEVGQELSMVSQQAVLGESIEEVVLPETLLIDELPMLEAPYDEIEAMRVLEEVPIEEAQAAESQEEEMTFEENNQVLGASTECVNPEDAEKIISAISQQIDNGAMSGSDRQILLSEILTIQNKICR